MSRDCQVSPRGKITLIEPLVWSSCFDQFQATDLTPPTMDVGRDVYSLTNQREPSPAYHCVRQYLAQVVMSLRYFKKLRYLGRISIWFKSYPFPTEMNLPAKLFFLQEVAWILPHKIVSHKAWLRLFWNRIYPKQMLTVPPRLIKNSQ